MNFSCTLNFIAFRINCSPTGFFFFSGCFLVPLEGLRSQSQFDEMRTSYIRELVKAIGLRQKGVVANSQRFYQLTKLMDSMHDVSLFVNVFCSLCKKEMIFLKSNSMEGSSQHSKQQKKTKTNPLLCIFV